METFTATCFKEYDRHHYKVVHKDGKCKMFVSWDLAQGYWWQVNRLGTLSHIDVVDIKPQSKGFGG